MARRRKSSKSKSILKSVDSGINTSINEINSGLTGLFNKVNKGLGSGLSTTSNAILGVANQGFSKLRSKRRARGRGKKTRRR